MAFVTISSGSITMKPIIVRGNSCITATMVTSFGTRIALLECYERGQDEVTLCSLAKSALEEISRMEREVAPKTGLSMKAEMLNVLKTPLILYKEAEEQLEWAPPLTRLCCRVRDAFESVCPMRTKLVALELKARTYTKEEIFQDFYGISTPKADSEIPADFARFIEKRDGDRYVVNAEHIMAMANKG